MPNECKQKLADSASVLPLVLTCRQIKDVLLSDTMGNQHAYLGHSHTAGTTIEQPAAEKNTRQKPPVMCKLGAEGFISPSRIKLRMQFVRWFAARHLPMQSAEWGNV